MQKHSRVWIQLERPEGSTAALRNALGTERSEKLSVLLTTLGYPYEQPVWWTAHHQTYCLVQDYAGGFVELEDCGFWFDLDTLADRLSDGSN
jgi:hypothetical protein